MCIYGDPYTYKDKHLGGGTAGGNSRERDSHKQASSQGVFDGGGRAGCTREARDGGIPEEYPRREQPGEYPREG